MQARTPSTTSRYTARGRGARSVNEHGVGHEAANDPVGESTTSVILGRRPASTACRRLRATGRVSNEVGDHRPHRRTGSLHQIGSTRWCIHSVGATGGSEPAGRRSAGARASGRARPTPGWGRMAQFDPEIDLAVTLRRRVRLRARAGRRARRRGGIGWCPRSGGGDRCCRHPACRRRDGHALRRPPHGTWTVPQNGSTDAVCPVQAGWRHYRRDRTPSDAAGRISRVAAARGRGRTLAAAPLGNLKVEKLHRQHIAGLCILDGDRPGQRVDARESRPSRSKSSVEQSGRR